MIWEMLQVAWDSLMANKLRSVLTTLGVLIGVAAVITMLAIGQGAREQQLQLIQQMGANVVLVFPGQFRRGAIGFGMGSVQTLTMRDVEALSKGNALVVQVAAEVRRGAQVVYRQKNTNTSVMGVSANYPTVRAYKVEKGRFFTEQEDLASAKVAVLGQTVVTNLFGENANPVGKTIRINGTPFKVIGVLARKGALGPMDMDDQIMIPLRTAMYRLFGTDYLSTISVQIVRNDFVTAAMQEIERILRRSHRLPPNKENDFVIRTQAEWEQLAEQTSRLFIILLLSIASVSLIVGGIGIMNIMLVSVAERTREIGIRKAIGAKPSDIQLQFLLEAVVLSLVGGGLGIFFGVVSSYAIGKVAGWTIVVSPLSVILAFGFAAAVGIFFGYYPARKAARLEPVEALRYE
ncbi:MAG: ABC transporter permease [Armatimonadetes bacterium]|nr:ABC transporter permease [Armatimonadota bacterium]MCX7969442.1 ABC transporter permease [Armatimonadota bacterium]MDW8142440.1 ABC transporter permease [Armatimonadota bacterium]